MSLLAVHLFITRSWKAMHHPYYAYSRGFWSCLCSGILNIIVALGFTVDWLLSFPYSKLSVVLKGLVVPNIMVCTMVVIGALSYMNLEDWTYSEALTFCWTAVATIGTLLVLGIFFFTAISDNCLRIRRHHTVQTRRKTLFSILHVIRHQYCWLYAFIHPGSNQWNII